jgi:hypothetical protein
MKALRIILIGLVAGAALPVLADGAQAQDGLAAGTAAGQCVRGCAALKRECVATGRTTALACKLDCRANTAPTELGTCMRGCSSAFGDTKDMCRADQRPASPAADGTVDGACLGACGSDLADCAKAVGSDGRTCRKGCRDADDRPACLAACGAAAQAGGQSCVDAFTACGASCGAP